MKLATVALDYDGTIAVDGAMDAQVRQAIAGLRLHGIAVILATGRRLTELKTVAGNLECFNAIVAENGAVLCFPESRRHAVLGHPPSPRFLDALKQHRIDFAVGESVVETAATNAAAVLSIIHTLELPLMLSFNRGRLMALPPGISKSTGLSRALSALRLSVHNTVGIGDGENDHDLLDVCEVGVAVQWGSPALRAVADEVIAGADPSAVAPYLQKLARQVRLSPRQMGRRRVHLGYRHDGQPVDVAIRGRTVIVAGEPGSGKSWLAGLHCEQLILQGYSLCIIDPEGDYLSLEALPGVLRLGGDDRPPRARELIQALRYHDMSIVIDLSKLDHNAKAEYLRELMPTLAALRRQTGLPHKIVLDEAHYYLAAPHGRHLVDAELAGYIFVTYRVSALDPEIRNAADTVVMVTRETDVQEQRTLRTMCETGGGHVRETIFQELALGEAALLPGVEESGGVVQRFQIGPRLTAHVRHRAKYLDMPVSEPEAFVFRRNGPTIRARSLKEFVELLAKCSDNDLLSFLHRHDFSRWISDVFHDCPLATQVRAIEKRAGTEPPRDLIDEVARAVRARYETVPAPAEPPA